MPEERHRKSIGDHSTLKMKELHYLIDYERVEGKDMNELSQKLASWFKSGYRPYKINEKECWAIVKRL